jgi:hypothetical protein
VHHRADLRSVFFVDVGRGEVGASAEPPCEEFSGGRGYFKVVLVGLGDGCMWVSGVDDKAESGCVEGEAAILVFGERNGCMVCAHLFHCCGGRVPWMREMSTPGFSRMVEDVGLENTHATSRACHASSWKCEAGSSTLSAAMISSCSLQTKPAAILSVADYALSVISWKPVVYGCVTLVVYGLKWQPWPNLPPFSAVVILIGSAARPLLTNPGGYLLRTHPWLSCSLARYRRR